MRNRIFGLFAILVALIGAAPAEAACWSWSKTASSNATADSSINFSEGMSPSSVNDSARAMMARLAECRDDLSGVLQTTGGPVAYAVTTNQGLNAVPVDGQSITIRLNVTNGAASTLVADGGTAYALQSAPGSAVASGTMIAGTPYRVTFNLSATAWVLQDFYNSPLANGSVTYAKIQNVGASRLLGNTTGSPAVVGEIPLGSGAAFVGGALTSYGLAPTITVLTSGSGATYFTPAGARWLEIIVQGGGSGGGGGNNGALSGAGGPSNFGGVPAGGGTGSSNQVVGAGGTAASGYINKTGSPGTPGNGPGLNHNGQGGTGGGTMFGGGGAGPSGNVAGAAAGLNTGAGGGGGGNTNGSLDGSGGNGGAAGGTVHVIANPPAASYVYTVGAGGAGAAGTNISSSAGAAGGAGGSGVIMVIEHY